MVCRGRVNFSLDLPQVSTTEGFGTVFNALTQSMINSVGSGPTSLLVQLAGQPLPAAAILPETFDPLRAPQVEVRLYRHS